MLTQLAGQQAGSHYGHWCRIWTCWNILRKFSGNFLAANNLGVVTAVGNVMLLATVGRAPSAPTTSATFWTTLMETPQDRSGPCQDERHWQIPAEALRMGRVCGAVSGRECHIGVGYVHIHVFCCVENVLIKHITFSIKVQNPPPSPLPPLLPSMR